MTFRTHFGCFKPLDTRGKIQTIAKSVLEANKSPSFKNPCPHLTVQCETDEFSGKILAYKYPTLKGGGREVSK